MFQLVLPSKCVVFYEVAATAVLRRQHHNMQLLRGAAARKLFFASNKTMAVAIVEYCERHLKQQVMSQQVLRDFPWHTFWEILFWVTDN